MAGKAGRCGEILPCERGMRMKEILLDFGAILYDLAHALRSGAKKVLIVLAVLAALLTLSVLYLMTPRAEIRSLTGFQCYSVPHCEVNYQFYHRDDDLYHMGIYKLNGQDAVRFVYWAQENGWSKMPLSAEALNSGMLDEATCPEAADIKQVPQGFWKQPNGMELFVFDSQTATLYIRKMPR